MRLTNVFVYIPTIGLDVRSAVASTVGSTEASGLLKNPWGISTVPKPGVFLNAWQALKAPSKSGKLIITLLYYFYYRLIFSFLSIYIYIVPQGRLGFPENCQTFFD